MIALLFRTVLVIHIEMLLCSYCLKDFCPGLQTPLFANSSPHLLISCNTPCLHPPDFLISPECYSRPKRNWRQWIYLMFGGQTRCITGDVQMANGTQSHLWGLAAINCGCGREGSDFQRYGKVSCIVICHWGKKKLKVSFRAWQLHFFITSGYTPSSETQGQLVGSGEKARRKFSSAG